MIPWAPTPEVEFEYALSGGIHLEVVRGPLDALLGYDAAAWGNSVPRFLSHLHLEDRLKLQRIFSLREDSAPCTMPVRVRHSDGRIRCLQIHIQKEQDTEKATLTLTLSEAFPDSESLHDLGSVHFSAMIENTEEAVFFKDRNHKFVATSPCFRRQVEVLLQGRSIAGLSDYDFLPEEDADKFWAAEARVFAEGSSLEELNQVAGTGDGKIWILSTYHPVRSATGEVLGLLATIRNLTEGIQAEEKIEELDVLTRAGSYVLDLKRGIFAISKSLQEIVGIDGSYPYTLETWRTLVHPEDRARMVQYLDSILEVPGRVFNQEYRIVRLNDGAIRWVHGIGRIDCDASGTPLLMKGSIEDITERKATESALLETKEHLQLFIEHAPAALAMFDLEMRYVAVSPRWGDIYGISPASLTGKHHYDMVPDLPTRWKEMHQRGLAGASERCPEDRFDRADGTMLWIRWEMLPWRLADGSVGGIVLFIEDVTEARLARQRLSLAASVFEHSCEAIIVIDLNGQIVEVNEALVRMTGFTREEIVGRSSDALRSERHERNFYRDMGKSVVENGRWQGEVWTRTKCGRDFLAGTTITTVRNETGEAQYYVALLVDFTQMREQQQQLERIVRYDALTGLPNRTLLAERLREAMTSARESHRTLAVIYIDLDNFKSVNDLHGRERSDALLVIAAARMKHVLREGDMLGRLGGDEFVAILPDLPGGAAAIPVLDRLLEVAGEPFNLGEHEIRISATAGATLYPQNQEVDADQLLRQADQAMYEAKLAGKKRYKVFDPVRDHSLRGQHEERARIRQALNAGEFVLYYQPKVNMATGALVGAEALIRWNHPERGILPPALFLPVIEDDVLSIDVGEWVIDAALAQIEQWMAVGREIRVSVNVSARQLQQPDFLERLCAQLEKHPGVCPTMLGLELLESSALQDVSMTSEIIKGCEEMGIRVAIDDFGTGYSSLSYLKRLPAKVLKIDQSFVRDMLDDTDDLAILQGIVGLATAFHRLPVAEGVESVGHGIVLLKLGCEVAQGYGIARPMPADDLFSWYANWRPDSSWANVTPLSPLHWPVLTAEVEQSAWVRALARFLEGETATAPELDQARCRFGLWLQAEHRKRGAHRVKLAMLDVLHGESHRMAIEAVEMKNLGRVADATEILAQIRMIRAQIQQQLFSLIDLHPSGTDAAENRPELFVGVLEASAKLQ